MVGLKMLCAFLIAWVIAQGVKVVVATIKHHHLGWKKVLQVAVKSGGMPSGHSASLTAMTVYCGMVEGFDSALFAACVGFTLIVLYDAMNVRWAVGEYGKILKENAEEGYGQAPKKIVEGHTPLQVTAGVLLGVVVGLLTFVIAG